MKSTLILAALVLSVAGASAQQVVPRDELLKITAIISLDLKQMLDTPIPTDPDTKRPVAMREGEHGCLVLPESKLSAETIARAAKDPVAVGQLWLRQAAPVSNGQRVSAEKLRTVRVNVGDQTETAVLCALGVRKGAGDQLQLLVYGKEKEPILQVPLKSVSATQENPIELDGVLEGESARVTLKLVGKYQATLDLTRD